MNHHFILTILLYNIIMQIFRSFSPQIRSIVRFLSSSIVNVTPTTTQNELNEINKLMKTYNNSHVPIRTIALFEWMTNIIDIKPNFISYLHIIRACSELNNINICQKIHQFIVKDPTLNINEKNQLQIKLLYMYGKIKHLQLAEEIFQQINKYPELNSILYGTMFKGERKIR